MDDFEEFSKNNIEELKTIAFKYQELNEGRKALKIYKKIANLRPNHAQSYRDLANSYLELKDYKNAWKIYKYYFIKGLKIESNDIGDILNSEMILTYLQRKKDTSFTEVLKTIDANKVIKSDVRFVFEWNTSEAEFIWEFVNSNKQVYTEENSLNADSDLIINQKTKGYTSKEFLIEKLENSPWLINLTYLGNKQYKSTILKLTTYYNWGEVNQSKKVETFELNVENLKIQLDKISF
jgi:tetratricopeptide (TPR) repeat protein